MEIVVVTLRDFAFFVRSSWTHFFIFKCEVVMKRLALLLALLLALSSLFFMVSCNQDNTNEKTTEISTETSEESQTEENEVSLSYILNKNTKKFHHTDCYAVDMMDEKNKIDFTGKRSEIISKGYKPCLKCNP